MTQLDLDGLPKFVDDVHDLCDPFYGASLVSHPAYIADQQRKNKEATDLADSISASPNLYKGGFISGSQLKADGIAATLAAERAAWRERAIGLLWAYAKLKLDDGGESHCSFPMEEYRGAWTELGYPEPHSPHCWGAITQTAYARKLIVPTGDWVQSKHPKAHRRFTRLWRAV